MAAALFLTGWLGYALMPILTPFAAALLLTYIGYPAHHWLVRHRINPSLAALLSMLGLLLALLAVMLILLPLLFQQVQALYGAVGKFVALAQSRWLPELQIRLGPNVLPDFEHLGTWASEHSESLRAAAPEILKGLGSRGMFLLQLATNIVLTPVVFFYFLRDSDRLIPRLLRLVPRRFEPTVSTLLKDIDAVLGAFLRGELMVMSIMSFLYTAGLWAVGLNGALPLGLLTGILTFIPFVGSTIGLVLGSLAAFTQFGSLIGVLPTLTVFLIGQSLESNFITPKLVGERIGLHPVAVIFALMAFWQLFGFIGVLLALPMAAILQVGLSHAMRHYRASHFYRRRRGPSIPPAPGEQG
ncbi:Predicted PurR-regulated permease PerM [Formivibrio citricus]|uniref:Predicted PurR-regulated permease PerM n=2 Tax=Formivibrio citricus TaxID=83765 RepID=A0A1I4WU34_9NEIS|nr:Predicted PurR-regulated permease PerM [Formivibrio citricus]